jgi:integrase
MPGGGTYGRQATGCARASQPRTLRRRHARTPTRCRRPPAIAGHAAWLPRRALAAQQGPAVRGRPADRRCDRCRDAARRHGSACGAPARAHHRAVRAGLRIHEALALGEADLDPRRGSLLVRRGKGGRRREVGMDDWAWEQLQPWLNARTDLPVGPLLCIAAGPTRGRAWSAGAARTELRHAAARAGVRRRFAPHHSAMLTPSRWHARASR